MQKLCPMIRVARQHQGVTTVLGCKFSTSAHREDHKSYKLLIVGGGTAGSAIANKFARKLGKGQLAVLEPSDVS